MSSGVAREIVVELRRRGYEVGRKGEQVSVLGPADELDESDRDNIRDHKSDILAWLLYEEQVASLELKEFAKGENALEIRVPFLTDTIFLVPRVEHIGRLCQQGVARGRIWTAGEWRSLLDLPERGDAIASAIKLRAWFGAELVHVGRAEPVEESRS